jgi:hypothetical protein
MLLLCVVFVTSPWSERSWTQCAAGPPGRAGRLLCLWIVYNRRTSGRMVFTVSEKQIKERDGAAYDLDKYVLGTDYVVRRAFKGERRMFRKGILDLSSDLTAKNFVKNNDADISPVIPQQEPDHIGKSTGMVAYEPNIIELSVVDPSLVEHKQNKPPLVVQLSEPVVARPANLDGKVRSARVVKKHQNQRWVETDTLGRVFVGEKGNQIKMYQLIQIKDGSLYLG